MKRVIIISPYSGKTEIEVKTNIEYAKKCMKDCITRGESPIAFHLLYPQILDDNNSEERKKGFKLAYEWFSQADYCIVYTDLGFSDGMNEDIKYCIDNFIVCIKRKLHA